MILTHKRQKRTLTGIVSTIDLSFRLEEHPAPRAGSCPIQVTVTCEGSQRREKLQSSG